MRNNKNVAVQFRAKSTSRGKLTIKFAKSVKSNTLAFIWEQIYSNTGRGLAQFVSFDVFVVFSKHAVDFWTTHTSRYLVAAAPTFTPKF